MKQADLGLTKNASGERDPEMHQSKKGHQWFFGSVSDESELKAAHIGVDASRFWCTRCAARLATSTMSLRPKPCCMGTRRMALGMPATKGFTNGPMPVRVWLGTLPCAQANAGALDKTRRSHQLIDELERLKAGIRAKVDHLFRVIKRQFRARGGALPLKKNTAQLMTLFALSNLWMVRGKLLGAKA
jgi:IS5 family transposase